MTEPTLHLLDDAPATADMVIIGGGIIGAATAFFAARAGIRAVVIERRPALATLTTPVATGAFRLQFDNAEDMALVREGLDLYRTFADQTGLTGYDIRIRQAGYLWLATEPATVARQQQQVAGQHEWGLHDVEWIDGDEARYRFPFLGDNVIGARWRQGDGWLDTRRLTMGYALASQQPILLDTEVTGIVVEGGRVAAVETSRGRIQTRQVVVATGPFAGAVAALAGVDVPLRLVRRQRVLLPDVPEVPADAPMTIDDETGVHWRPAVGGAHLMWPDPQAPAGPPLDGVGADDTFALRLLNPASPQALARISPFWRDVWRRNVGHWAVKAGQYAYTPDHRPFLGPTTVEGLAVNCGYSGHGIMASAGGSRITVDLISGAMQQASNPFALGRDIDSRHFDVI